MAWGMWGEARGERPAGMTPTKPPPGLGGRAPQPPPRAAQQPPGPAPRQPAGQVGVRGNGRVGSERTVDLLRDFVSEAQQLARQELRLARAELRAEAAAAGKAAGTVGAGGALAYAGLLGLMCAAIVGLAAAIPLWLSAFIVGGLVLAVGGLIAMGGMAKLRRLHPKPEQTTQTLKEDRRWASELMRDVRSRRRVHA